MNRPSTRAVAVLLAAASAGCLGQGRSVSHAPLGASAGAIVVPEFAEPGPVLTPICIDGESSSISGLEANAPLRVEQEIPSPPALPTPESPSAPPERPTVPRPTTDAYRVRPGDWIRASYFEPAPPAGEYRLRPGDEVAVEFLQLSSLDQDELGVKETPSALNRKVVVASDGTVSLPYLGLVPIAGKTLPEATADLEARYRRIYVEPIVLLTLAGRRGVAEELRRAGAEGGRVAVAPDGMVRLPGIGALPAAGRTLEEIESDAQRRMKERGMDANVSITFAGAAHSSFLSEPRRTQP